MSSAAVRPTALFEPMTSHSTADSSTDKTNPTFVLECSDTDSDDYHYLEDELSPDAPVGNEVSASRFEIKDNFLSVGPMKRINTSPPTFATDRGYKSDGSLASQASEPTDDNEAAFSEAGLLASNLENGKDKVKKKKPVHKLLSMKKKIKKTFSDVDVTPDVELSVDWKKLSPSHTSDVATHSKKKRKSRKSVPFTADFQVLSPSYKQKNDSFHKCFKQLPETERLLVDCSCALLKDLIVQGRLYVSQNYVCFHSTILKWQTAILIKFKDIEQITKEKTVKVIPNAIQFQIRGKDKSPTFTSFTQRDRTYQQIYKLWQNALADKPMTPQELWGNVHSHYGADLGCSSDEDYVRPEPTPTDELSNKKRKKKQTPITSEINNHVLERSSELVSDKSPKHERSSEDSKFSSRDSTNGLSEKSSLDDCSRTSLSDDDEASDHAKEDLQRTYLNRNFPVSAEQLFETIFGEGDFWKCYLQGKRCHDIEFESWQKGCDDYEGNQLRNLSYNLPLTNPLVPKSSHVEELQVLYKESEPGRCYAVDCIARTYGVPYSDYFSTIMRYAIRKTGRSTSELRITAQVKFHKTPWGLVKNFIDKNVHSGMEENFELLEQKLVTYFDRIKRVPPRRSNRTRNTSSSRPKTLGTNSAAGSFSIGDSSNFQEKAEFNEQKSFAAAPATEAIAVPQKFEKKQLKSNDLVRNESSSGKWLWRFFALLFFLLLWSNYSMYRRVSVLESLQPNLPLDSDSHADMINNCHEDSVTQNLRLLQRRFNVLEQLVRNLTTNSNRQWNAINSHWKDLEKTVVDFIDVIKSKDPT